MTKVYPNTTRAVSNHISEKNKCSSVNYTNGKSGGVLTVWRKSLLFNCDGFTVFDSKGNLVFRVDNYCAAAKAEIILMDASGNSLLTIRRKRLSMMDNWLMYKGDSTTNPILSVKKHINLLDTSILAHATSSSSSRSSSSSKVATKTDKKPKMIYGIEGSYGRRCCKIYDENRKVVAEIKPKEATTRGVGFGLDVFRLIIYPEMDSSIVMALVVLLDRMFGSSKRIHFH